MPYCIPPEPVLHHADNILSITVIIITVIATIIINIFIIL